MIVANDGRRFHIERGLVEVTSNHRPNEQWSFTDAAGHVHQWEWPGGGRTYRPEEHASVPTVRWVKTGTGYWEDGDEYDVGEHRCVQCEAVVQPGYCADSTAHYIAGLKRCYIDDRSVSVEEFEREAKAAGLL